MRYLYLLVFSLFAGLIYSQEAILNYQVEISILSDADIEVTEYITVRAEGNQIRRGIFRRIPTLRPNVVGKNELAPLDVLEVKRDGESEDYHTERTREDITIYIGHKDRILSTGEYTYQITYRASNHIGYFENYDELYWNVIGPDWSFPIHEYGVKIRLPEGADYLQGSCYTGRPGSTASNCMISAGAGEWDVVSRSDQGLHPGEGFTVAVAWPKNFVAQTSFKVPSFNWANILLYILALGIFGVVGFRWWKQVGVDPPKVSVVPDWHPPSGLSTAEISYIHQRKITSKAISSALINAAIQGVIRIENKKKKFTFYRTGPSTPLEEEEKVLVDGLLPSGSTKFELKSSTYRRYESAKSDFSRVLRSKLKLQDYFKRNWKQAILGTLLIVTLSSIAMCIGMYSLIGYNFFSWLITWVLLLIVTIFVCIPFYLHKWYKWLIAVPAVLFGTLLFTLFFTELWYYGASWIEVAIMAGISIFAAGFYNHLIFAPTKKGQETSAAIEGFRMYLNKSEKALLEYFTPPEKTPELFEKMLPFAIALGVENRWGKKFKRVLDEAIDKGTYSPAWYVGDIHRINSLHSNFQSSVSHAAPKSSSGSGGGGFSGGGGGGGGGGGW